MHKKTKINEANYIIGLDLGHRVALMNYLDHKTLKPVSYDLSGGYGETTVPLMLQYLTTEKDFLIGNDAKLNQFQDGTRTLNLMEILLTGKSVTLEERLLSPSGLFGIFMRKLLDSFKQLNPNAEIEALVIAIEDSALMYLRDILIEGMKPFTKTKVHVIGASEAILYYLLMNEVQIDEKVIVLDYGYANVVSLLIEKKDTVFEVAFEDEQEAISIKNIEVVFREEIFSLYKQQVDRSILSEQELKDLEQLFDQNFMSIFQKYSKEQGIKLYYNFAFPPFQKILTYIRMSELLEPFIVAFSASLQKLMVLGLPVITVGQGYKMLWPGQQVNKCLKSIEINPYEGISKGSCYLAASAYIPLPKVQVVLQEKVVKVYSLMMREEDQEVFLSLDENELIIIVDFEQEIEVKLFVVSRVAQNNYIIETEKTLHKLNEAESQVRLCVKLEHTGDQKVDLNIEYLPL